MSQLEAASGAIYQTLETKPGGWKFRWVLQYATGGKKYGGWNADYNDSSLRACDQSTTGLVCAYIEAMDANRVYHRAVECSGPEFCMFQWVHEGRINSYGPLQSRIVGMSLLTATETVTIYECGKAIVEARAPEQNHNSFHYGAEK